MHNSMVFSSTDNKKTLYTKNHNSKKQHTFLKRVTLRAGTGNGLTGQWSKSTNS